MSVRTFVCGQNIHIISHKAVLHSSAHVAAYNAADFIITGETAVAENNTLHGATTDDTEETEISGGLRDVDATDGKTASVVGAGKTRNFRTSEDVAADGHITGIAGNVPRL